MFSRLTQGVSSVLHELSGEENADGELQDVVVPQSHPTAGGPPEDTRPSGEVLERLAQTEQLVIQLKELIREKDSQLASSQKHLKEEKEQAEVKFTKLKLQAKAKMASLNKQIIDLKGQEALNTSQSSESSFQLGPEVEEELQQLKEKLREAELSNKMLQQQLWEAEQRVREEGHAEQVRILQAVVKEKDVRFQEQILKHEQELLSLSQASNELELQQALRASQQRIEELGESLRSRSEVLEMLQQELNSADQQKQILTTQFRQMELELAEAQRPRQEEMLHQGVDEELVNLKERLVALESEREQIVNTFNAELLKKSSELEELRAKLELEEREKKEVMEKRNERETAFEAELASMRVCLESRMEMSENEREQSVNALKLTITDLNAELLKKTTEIDEMKALAESQQREMEETMERLRCREADFEEELANVKATVKRLENENLQAVSAINLELQEKTAELKEMSAKLQSEESENSKMQELMKERQASFEEELTNMKTSFETRLEMSTREKEQAVISLNVELESKTIELGEMRAKFELEQREFGLKLREREACFKAELTNIRASLETSESGKEQTISALHVDLHKTTTELVETRATLESEQRMKQEILNKTKDREASFEKELANLKASLEERLELAENESNQRVSALNEQLDEIRTQLHSEQNEKGEVIKKVKEREAEIANMKVTLEASESEKQQEISSLNEDLAEIRVKLEIVQRSKNEMLDQFKEREASFEEDLANVTASLEARLETSESEKQQAIGSLNEELAEIRMKLDVAKRTEEEMMDQFKEKEASFEEDLNNLKASLEVRLETSEGEKRQTINSLNKELAEIRVKLEVAQRTNDEITNQLKERGASFEEELVNMKTSLEAQLEISENEKEKAISTVNAELQKKTTEVEGLREKLSAEVAERTETLQQRQTNFERELANIQACLDVAEKQREETARMLEVAGVSHTEELQQLQGKLEEAKIESDRWALMKTELAFLRETLDASKEEQKSALQTREVLEKLWKGIQTLTSGDAEESLPKDPGHFLEVLPSLQTRLSSLTEEQLENQAHISQITLALESMQGQLDDRTVEGEKAAVRIQELEHQLLTLQVAGESSEDHVTDPSVRDLNRTHQDNAAESEFQTDRVLFLEQLLAERESELFDLREKFATHRSDLEKRAHSGDITAMDISTECSQEDETTLVAVDSSVLSVSAENDSSPELIAPQPGTPGDSKGTSSDEMVTSSDSEVAHSSWTLLEAVNQDGTQEWTSQSQDFASLRLSTQSWEETCAEQISSKSCLVDIESSSLVINENVKVVGRQESDLMRTDPSSQFLGEDIQKRYRELLGELEQFKDSASQSQEKANQLEEALKLISVCKDEAESRANIYEKELNEVKALMEQDKLDGQNILKQLESLKNEVQSKDENMQSLQEAFYEVQQRLAEQEAQDHSLAGRLEERELISSQLKQKVLDLETSLAQISLEANLVRAALIEKTAELDDLQKCLSQKDQEMMEINASMSAKLLQVGEEKCAITSEVKKLKEQINELESLRDDQQKLIESEELLTLRREKEELVTQVGVMKKDGDQIKRKLQAALIQRKELLKKVAEFEKESGSREEKDRKECDEGLAVKDKEKEIQKLEALLQETKDALSIKEETLAGLQEKIQDQNQALAEFNAEIQRLTQQHVQMSEQQMSQVAEDKNNLLSQISSLEFEIETLRKKAQEATEVCEVTVLKAQEKDHHHLVQIKELKEQCNNLIERLQAEEGEKSGLVNRITDLEFLLTTKTSADEVADENVGSCMKPNAQNKEKPETNDWAQEDWVDFAAAEAETSHKQFQQPLLEQHDTLNSLQEKLKAEQAARAELEAHLQESQSSKTLSESKFTELFKEYEALKENERHVDALTEEMETLREKSQRAELLAEELKAELNEAWKPAQRSIAEAESPIKALQSEVEEFKQFIQSKNEEIVDLSQQLSEQSSLLHKIQETVKEKDVQIASLQDGLEAEKARVQKLEAEMPQREEEEKDNSAKLQQLQRKLQAALVSRKEALKEKQALKEEQAAAETIKLELQQKLELIEIELSKTREEREKLIVEVDRALLANQNLNASCESLKLAMEGVLNEKETCRRQAEMVKEESEQVCRQLEDKVQTMKEEYESLLKSYENVSDEAERVRRVLEAARQERQELAAKARVHEAAKQEAERLAEEATKEVDVVKDKMRKFAKIKHQKIMELEEENERLRELEEKKTSKHPETESQQELDRLKQEFEALKTDFNSATAERNAFELETEELRQRLTEEVERKGMETLNSITVDSVVEVKVIEQQKSPVVMETQDDQSDFVSHETELSIPLESFCTAPKQLSEVPSKIDFSETEERLKELESSLEKAENKIKELEAAIEDTLVSRNNQASLLDSELASLKQQLQDSLEREGVHIEEINKRESQLQQLRISLESERDDLEEKLMNQLAQVNGSIAGYQQEASDGRERLTELQREMEKLERERAELEAKVASERDRSCRMEEDMRQAHRERAEAEAETGKQRELEQKLKSAQRFKEGSQNRARQLEELLREKQLEVRQLQKDCIEYQERISELAKEVKSVMLMRDEVKAEVEAGRVEIGKILQDKAGIAAELSTCRGKLDLALEEAKQAHDDKLAAEQLVRQQETELKAEAESTLDEVRYRLGAELKQMELRLENSYLDREREEEATLEAKNVAEAADKHAQKMQARLDEALARLAAFSRSMSSLQNDRDRVLDEAKQWENRFHSELQEKESDVRAAETRAKELSEKLLIEMNQKEDLQSSVERMQKAEENLQVELSAMKKKHNESLEAHEEERQDLLEKLALAETDLTQARSLLTNLETEAEGLQHRSKALEEAVDRLQTDANEARVVIKEREVEERRLCLILEQLETDLGSSKNLTETLQEELDEKEKREVELLGEKEQAVAQAVEEARKDADGRAEMAEKELEQRKVELRGLEERLRKAEEDTFQSRAQLESFTKAMGSLQDDRERVLSQYKQLEEKHLQVMIEKDGLIQEAAGENNRIKEELRSLFSQRDDLYAENAKLAAQLHGYRNDLNQVLAMKDSQHKQILSSQVERIGFLERERNELKNHLQALERDVGRGPALEKEILIQASEGVDIQGAPGAEVEKLREQLQASTKRVAMLEETLESEKEAQAVHNKELKELRWEGGILRTETETAEERVAELARDLLSMEQQLLEERESVSQLRAQNQSFGQAMSSLQTSRDQAVTEAQELRLHLEDMNRTGQTASFAGDSKGEVWSLKNALSALQNDRERMLEQLHVQRFEMDRLSLALEEERRKAVKQEEKIGAQFSESDPFMDFDKQELEMLRLERLDWQGQAELLKQQTLTTLSGRDQQIRHLTAMLEDAQASKLQQEHTQRQGRLALDAAPGGPLEHSEGFKAECVELQRRLDEESEQRLRLEEQLMAAQDRLKRYTQGDWQTSSMSETAVLIEPPEGAVTRTRSGGAGLLRMLRVAFCSRQRTPLLVSLYLLTVHLLLLLCMGGFL